MHVSEEAGVAVVSIMAMSEQLYNRLPTGRKKTTYVHEESHDSGTEEASHGHSHEPGNKYVPEEAPVHSLPRADPAHSYHGAHLEEQRHLSRNEVVTGGHGGEERRPSQTPTFSCL